MADKIETNLFKDMLAPKMSRPVASEAHKDFKSSCPHLNTPVNNKRSIIAFISVTET